jgi:hypothetical protein
MGTTRTGLSFPGSDEFARTRSDASGEAIVLAVWFERAHILTAPLALSVGCPLAREWWNDDTGEPAANARE